LIAVELHGGKTVTTWTGNISRAPLGPHARHVMIAILIALILLTIATVAARVL
jgi:hypothetical protein